MKNIFARGLCCVLIVCMGVFSSGAYADMVGTDKVAAAAMATGARDTLRSFIERGEVRDQLQDFGISHASALSRVDAMTDAEVASIAGRIERLPAGGLSVAAVLITLLIVDLIWINWVK